ncbi:MAG: DNA polymerase III subunit delta, partial [Pseudomonadota bacterium]
MKLKPAQLPRNLKEGLAPLYVLMGDEPLQKQEALDAIRSTAAQQGFDERTVLDVEANFDWAELNQAAGSLSLFSNKRLLEVRLGDRLPGDAGGKALSAYANQPPPDTLLLIIANYLSAANQKAKWFQTLEKQGVVIQSSNIDTRQLPGWIQQRMKQYKLQATPEAVTLLAERAEGNLLAVAQEIEKLSLLYENELLDAPQILEAVADSARFGVFGWIDVVMAGNPSHITRQLERLREEGTEVIIIATMLEREIRRLYQIALALRKGQPERDVFRKNQIWQNRTALVQQTLKRHPPKYWPSALRFAVRIEHIIKGLYAGDPWNALQQLGLSLGGCELGLLPMEAN